MEYQYETIQATFFEPNRLHCRPRLSVPHSLAWPVQLCPLLLAYSPETLYDPLDPKTLATRCRL
jgi:hypothetical protein